MDKIAIIPARMGSTRFPGKPLALINGVPMVMHVYDNVCMAGFDDVIIATDDNIIFDIVNNLGGKIQLTNPAHESGTDRVAEVATQFDDNDIIINIQGDLPFVNPAILNQLMDFTANSKAHINTICIEKSADQDHQFYDDNVVKVVIDKNHRALYFSRRAIPACKSPLMNCPVWNHHIGIYAFHNYTLQKIVKDSPSPYEVSERLEQLRWLQNGYQINVICVDDDCGPDINTPKDLELIR